MMIRRFSQQQQRYFNRIYQAQQQSIPFKQSLRFVILDKRPKMNTIEQYDQMEEQQQQQQQQQFQRHEDLLDKETRELMDEEIARSVRETEQKLKMVEKDAIFNAFTREFKELEMKMWAKFRQAKIPVKPSTIQYVKERVAERGAALEQKYKHIARLVGDQIRSSDQSKTSIQQQAKAETNEEKKKAYDHLVNHLNTDQSFANDPMFFALQSAFEKATGQKVNPEDLNQQVSAKDLEKFFKKMEGPEGKQIEERMNTVFNDKKLREMGIEPNEFNPDLLERASKQQQSGNASAPSSDNSQTQQQEQATSNKSKNFDFSQTKFDNMKHQIQKELEKNPGLSKYLLEETGSTLETMFEEFEKDLKSGTLYSSLSNAERVMLINTFTEAHNRSEQETMKHKSEKQNKQSQ
jgi:hypothetical protein